MAAVAPAHERSGPINRGPRTTPGERLGRALGVLRYADYRLLWAAGLISLLGDSMQHVAEGWLVLDLTGSPAALSTTFALSSAPVALLTLAGGVYADRWDRRTTLLAVNAGRLALVAILALLTATGLVQVWHIWIMAVCMGLLTAFGGPAIQSLLPSLVPAGAIAGAIGLHLASSSLTGIVGRSTGGWLVAAAGIWPVFVLNALSFVAPIGALSILRHRVPARATRATNRNRTTFYQELRAAFSYLRTHPDLGAVLLIWSSFSLLEVPAVALAPVFVREVLQRGPEALGLCVAGFSAGFFCGSLAAARWAQRVARPLPFATTGIGATFCLLLFANGGVIASGELAYALTVLGMAGIGAFIGFMGVTQQTIMTTGTPEGMRGRVLSLNMVGLSAPIPLGNVLQGALAERLGAPASVTLGAATLLLVLLAAAITVKVRAR
jgi:MFS family permease